MPDDNTVHRLPLPVVVRPDPMLDEQPAGPFRIATTVLAAAAVVALVFYGLSRPSGPVQTASAPAQSGQGATPPPSTTGSGQGQPQGQPQDQPDRKAPAPTPPAAGSSSTGATTGSGGKAAPQPNK